MTIQCKLPFLTYMRMKVETSFILNKIFLCFEWRPPARKTGFTEKLYCSPFERFLTEKWVKSIKTVTWCCGGSKTRPLILFQPHHPGLVGYQKKKNSNSVIKKKLFFKYGFSHICCFFLVHPQNDCFFLLSIQRIMQIPNYHWRKTDR